jgi:hypothetical protein
LSTRHGNGLDNYTNTTFDDEATNHITSGIPPYTGSFRPDQFLSTLDGTSGNGTWKLEVVDSGGGDTGTLTAWSITLTTAAPPVCNVCSASAAGEATNLLWTPGGKTSLGWNPASNASYQSLYRGAPADLPGLLSGAADSCTRSVGGSAGATGITEVPSAGSFFWYLATGANGNGEGSAGNATAGPRDIDTSGPCP